MSVYQPLEPEDEALVRDLTPKPEEVIRFCNQFNGMARDACFREAWPLFREQIKTPEGLEKFCSYTTDEGARRTCISTSMNINTVYLVIDHLDTTEPLVDFCTKLLPIHRSDCFAFAAVRLVQIDPGLTKIAVNVCRAAMAAGYPKDCFHALVTYGKISFNTALPEYMNFCKTLPSPWSDSCLKETKPAP